MSLYQTLRQEHSQFFYKSANWQITDDGLLLSWQFEVSPNFKFQPKMAIPLPTGFVLDETKKVIFDNLVFQIGLVEMLSYWKATASPQIIIEARWLNPDQISWWHKLLIQGLGEYFYTNQIEFTDQNFVTIQTTQPKETHSKPTSIKPTKSNQNCYLIPLGGGKDSIVTLELMRQYQSSNQVPNRLLGLAINPTSATKNIAQIANLPLIEVRRQLDPQLLHLNSLGYLNGHTPFSALVAMVSLLVAYIYNCSEIILSNEKSSNEGNTHYLGQSINHQYSKTFEFESDFRSYVQTYVQPLVPEKLPYYYSLLRPFYELQIGRMFAKLGQPYFSVFRSCNRGQKTGVWCGECAKCLFAFSILFPFLGEDQTISIFGQNLFQNHDLLQIALELIGQKATKPFDCVGTHMESVAAFYLSSQWYLKNNQPLPYVLLQLQPQLARHSDLPDQVQQILSNWDENHFVSNDLSAFMKSRFINSPVGQ